MTIRRIEITPVKNGYILNISSMSENGRKNAMTTFVYNSIDGIADHLKNMPTDGSDDTDSPEYTDDMGLDEPEYGGIEAVTPIRRR